MSETMLPFNPPKLQIRNTIEGYVATSVDFPSICAVGSTELEARTNWTKLYNLYKLRVTRLAQISSNATQETPKPTDNEYYNPLAHLLGPENYANYLKYRQSQWPKA